MGQRHPETPGDEVLARRTTRAVFEDHLRLRRDARLEEDLARNYSPGVVLLTEQSIIQGHDAIRRSADRLHLQLPDARFEWTARRVSGDYAFLVWRARSDRYRVECGADSFVIQEGRIVMQTIHYRLLPPS